jgi:hypothetical protein
MDFRRGTGGRLRLVAGSSWLGNRGSVFGLERFIVRQRRFISDFDRRRLALCKEAGVVQASDLRIDNVDDCGWCRTFLPSKNQR